MNEQNDSTDKIYEPTPRKLEKARQKGDLPRSTDMSVAMAYCGFLFAAFSFGPTSFQELGAALSFFLAQGSTLAELNAAEQSKVVFSTVVLRVFLATLPWFLIPLLMVVTALLAQRSIVFVPSKLKPKGSRIALIQNAKQKYGRVGLFEFFKSFLKLSLFCTCLWIFISARLPNFVASLRLPNGRGIPLMLQEVIALLTAVSGIALVVGLIDLLWQRGDHLRRNRMSHKELKDEMKDAEGDPHMKQNRQSRARDIAQRQMMADVPKADVVIVNPTHFAVALAWQRDKREAPRCVAKGTDHLAKTIRDIAQENGIPIQHDPPVARALYAEIEVGQEIKTQHYQAVAAAIRFADNMRKKRWRSL